MGAEGGAGGAGAEGGAGGAGAEGGAGGAGAEGGAGGAGGMPERGLEALFAEPTPDELAAIREDWAVRPMEPMGWRVEGTTRLGPYRVDVVSHVVDGFRHYGAIRFPRNYDADGSYPVIVKNHGGGNGHSVVSVRSLGVNTPGHCSENVFVIGATYRGEELRAGQDGLAEAYLAEGADPEADGYLSPALDRDADDVIHLLSGTLANVAGADPARVGMVGGSRGGGVSYMVAVRDPRIQRVAIYYGASNHISQHMYETIETFIETGRRRFNPPTNMAYEVSVGPFLDGEMTFEEARLSIIRRSGYFFIEDMPSFQLHHGARDMVVRVEHSRQVDARLRALGRANFQYFEYPEGNHSVNSLDGAADRANTFLCGLE